jgi:hypothetical protein
MAYDWPGNVRELQNTILQAVVLAEGDLVTLDGLQLHQASRSRPRVASLETGAALERVSSGAPDASSAARVGGVIVRFDAAWRILRERVETEVRATMASGAHGSLPLGKWLNHDLVLEAYDQSGQVMARAATSVGLPETTFTRRLRQAETHRTSTRQPDSWAAVRTALADLLRAAGRPSGNLADQIDHLAFETVVAHVPDRISQAAALMGLSVPTMKRRLSESRALDRNLNICA